MKLETLHDLYVDELKDLYNAEHQLLKALPKMAKAASAPQLAKAFTEHLEQTKGHVDRLEKIFKKLDASPKGKTCKAMQGRLEEGKIARYSTRAESTGQIRAKAQTGVNARPIRPNAEQK